MTYPFHLVVKQGRAYLNIRWVTTILVFLHLAIQTESATSLKTALSDVNGKYNPKESHHQIIGRQCDRNNLINKHVTTLQMLLKHHYNYLRWTSIGKIVLSDKELDCNCQTQQFIQWARSNCIEVIATCSRPYHLKGSPVRILYDQDLGCAETKQGESRSRRKRSPDDLSYASSAKPKPTIECNFQVDLCGWKQLQNIDYYDYIYGTWKSSNTRNTSQTYIADHTTRTEDGSYLYLESDHKQANYYADLLSPLMILPVNITNVVLEFYSYDYGNESGNMEIWLTYPQYDSKPQLKARMNSNPIANTVSEWHFHRLHIIPQHPQYQIILRTLFTNTSTSNNVIAIDDVKVYPEEISCYTGNGSFYIGSQSESEDGLACQDWLDQHPHSHSFIPTSYRRYRYNLDYNRCRNPDLINRNRPWCLTTNSSIQWQYCDIPRCSMPSQEILTDILANKTTPPIYLLPTFQNYSRVAIYHKGRWGTICNRNISQQHADNVASVICRQLGIFNYGRAVVTPSNAKGSDVIWLNIDDIHCQGHETNLTQCLISQWNSYNPSSNKTNNQPLDTFGSCTHNYDLSIMCYYSSIPYITTPTPTNATVSPTTSTLYLTPNNVSLGAGHSINQGYVRVLSYHHGIRPVGGIICVNRWTMHEADVVCRQLGFAGAISATGSFTVQSRTNHTPWNIWLSNVTCNGYETKLTDCWYEAYVNNPVVATCHRRQIASVVCQNKSAVNQSATSCSFDNGLCRWKVKSGSGNLHWIWHNSGREHFKPLPSTPDESYLYVLKPPNDDRQSKAIFESPILQTQDIYTVNLQFDLRFEGILIDTLAIELVDGRLGPRQVYTTSPGNVPQRAWISKTVKLNPASSSYQIRFIAYSNVKLRSPSLSVIAIDNIVITDEFSQSIIAGIGAGTAGALLIVTLALILYAVYRSHVRRKQYEEEIKIENEIKEIAIGTPFGGGSNRERLNSNDYMASTNV